MTHVSFSELRANMASHFDRLLADRDELVVTRQNREPVVIMPLAELESLRETLHLLSSEENASRLRSSIEALERGEGIVADLLPDP
jgi:antitoxin YefM